VKRFEIIVKGIVQKVGYRDYVEEVARRLGIVGFVENVKDGSVRIICETQEMVKRFIDQISIKEGLIKVEDIQIKDLGIATGEFKYFEIKYGTIAEELGDRMITLIKYMSAIWDEIKKIKQILKE
jgi:acylphosphatase